LSCETGVGPIYKNDGSYAVSEKDKAVTLNKFFSSVCTFDNKVMPECLDKIPSGEMLEQCSHHTCQGVIGYWENEIWCSFRSRSVTTNFL
jgi:hypothetical protein